MQIEKIPTNSLEHPIDPHVAANIQARLSALEIQWGVHVLFACESGSRGWGFASLDSDYDVRFIYVQPLAWYLRVSKERDVIELPLSDVFDINGWELRKTLSLLKKGNATLIEWLNSPVVYRADADFMKDMTDALQLAYSPQSSYYHYIHMARGNYREYLLGKKVRLKKYLYVLRPLLATLWVEQGLGLVPMRFQVLVDTLVKDTKLLADIEELLTIKRTACESEYGKQMPSLNAFIDAQLRRLESANLPQIAERNFSNLDRLLCDTVLRFDTSQTR